MGLLFDVAVILGTAFPLLLISRKLRLPEIITFLLTGILIGPHALAWVRNTAQVETVAELGVALILFFVGLHMPIGRLRSLGRSGVASGALQMGLTLLFAVALLGLVGIPPRTAIFYGLLLSLSSTAVVLPILGARDEMGAPFARRFLAVSLFQDLALIPLILVVPLFAPAGTAPPIGTILLRVAIALAGIAALVIVARIALPAVLRHVTRHGSREILTAGAIVLIVGTIAFAQRLGISAALGAFAAGAVVGETEYMHEISGVLRPFRDFLSSLFFASIGMLLDPRFLVEHPFGVAAAVIAAILVKLAAAYPAFRAGGIIPRTSIRAAFAIAPVGEFSFLVAQAGKSLGIVDAHAEQFFLSVAVITLACTPLFLWGGKRSAQQFHGASEEDEQKEVLSGHIVIAGYGLNGQNVARVLSQTAIPHLVIEEDQDRVAVAREMGSRTVLGDAADPAVLRVAGIERAFGAVVAISDVDGTRAIVRMIRALNAGIRIIVRTRYVAEVETLRLLGADEVIPEEFETSIEIVMRVLRIFHVPGNIVAAQLRLLRDEGYRIFRAPEGRAFEASRLSAIMAAGTYDTFLVLPGSAADGKALAQLHLADGRVSAPVVLRDGSARAPGPEETLLPGDTLLLVGAHEDLMRAVAQLEKTP